MLEDIAEANFLAYKKYTTREVQYVTAKLEVTDVNYRIKFDIPEDDDDRFADIVEVTNVPIFNENGTKYFAHPATKFFAAFHESDDGIRLLPEEAARCIENHRCSPSFPAMAMSKSGCGMEEYMKMGNFQSSCNFEPSTSQLPELRTVGQYIFYSCPPKGTGLRVKCAQETSRVNKGQQNLTGLG